MRNLFHSDGKEFNYGKSYFIFLPDVSPDLIARIIKEVKRQTGELPIFFSNRSMGNIQEFFNLTLSYLTNNSMTADTYFWQSDFSSSNFFGNLDLFFSQGFVFPCIVFDCPELEPFKLMTERELWRLVDLCDTGSESDNKRIIIFLCRNSSYNGNLLSMCDKVF